MLLESSEQCLILTSDSTEASDKLWALLGLVGDDLQRGTEALVVVCQPLKQRLVLHKFQLYPALSKAIAGYKNDIYLSNLLPPPSLIQVSTIRDWSQLIDGTKIRLHTKF